MIINHKNKFIIFHIPKCAGKILRKTFQSEKTDTGDAWWHWSYSQDYAAWQDLAHGPLNELRNLEIWNLVMKYTTIAVIRNPYNRFKSSLNEHKTWHKRESDKEILDELDEIRISRDPRYIHFCPMHLFTHIGNKRFVDFIAHQETLVDDLRYIGYTAGFNESFFKQLETIPVPEPVREQMPLADNLTSIINRFYIRDFQLFNYPMINSKKDSEDKSLFEKIIAYPYNDCGWASMKPQFPYSRIKESENIKNSLLKIKQDFDNRQKELETSQIQLVSLKKDSEKSILYILYYINLIIVNYLINIKSKIKKELFF